MVVIDCTSPPPADAMRAAGVTGLCRYLAYVKPTTDFKRITQPEYDQLRAAGFDVVLNWEMSATDWLGGSSAGAAHAAEAVKQAQALGYPAGCAIPGSADFNMTATDWNGPGWRYAAAYSQGIRAGGYIAGVYGPWDVLTWCSQLGGFGMFWQAGMSTSWSGGRNAQPWPGAHLRQRRSGFIGGYDVDFNDQLQTWYGQYGVDAANTGDDMAFLDDPNAAALAWRVDALAKGTDTVQGGPTIGEPMWLVKALKAIPDQPAADPAAVAAALTPEQIAAGLTAAGITPEAVADALATHFHVS